VVADLSDLTAHVIDTILVNNIVDTITRVTTAPEFRVDSKAMFHVVTLYELLSIHASAHSVLYTPIDNNKTGGLIAPKGVLNQVSPYLQALKLLNYLSEKGDSMDIYAKTISSILSFCYCIISVAPRKESFIENTTLLKSCCRVLCKSRLASLKQEAVSVFYLFAARTTAIAGVLLQSRSHIPFAEALMNFTIEDANAKKTAAASRADGGDVSDDDESEVEALCVHAMRRRTLVRGLCICHVMG
jgi:hypothetical protein